MFQQTLTTAILPALMIVAAATDVTAYKIPNWLTGLTAVLFFPVALLAGMPLHEFGYHLFGGAMLFVLGFVMFSLGLFGGGDAKIMAAAGLWFGTSQTIPFIMATAVAGGLLAMIVLAWAAFSNWAEIKDLKLSQKINKLKPDVPYGVALAIGAILTFPDSWWMQAANQVAQV